MRGKVWLKELEREKGETQAELSELEIFDKDRLKTLIEKVAVYGEDAVEIVWEVRNPFDGEISA